MAASPQDMASSSQRMTRYRQRLREAGLKPVQIWVQDTASPAFIEKCIQQSRVIATHDPAGDAVMREIDALYEWPEA